MSYDFETERLGMRSWSETDAFFLLSLNSDPEIIRYTADTQLRTLSEAAELIRTFTQYQDKGYGHWVIESKHLQRPVGWCSLKNELDSLGIVELGYRIQREHRFSGFATESAQAALHAAFQRFGVARVTARVALENEASVNVVRKLGMHFQKRDTCAHLPADWFCISREEWHEQQV